jgi:hypothetical protein
MDVVVFRDLVDRFFPFEGFYGHTCLEGPVVASAF